MARRLSPRMGAFLAVVVGGKGDGRDLKDEKLVIGKDDQVNFPVSYGV